MKPQKCAVRDMGENLARLNPLNELDATGVEPMEHVIEMMNVLREVGAGESLPRKVSLDGTASLADVYVLCPKILRRAGVR